MTPTLRPYQQAGVAALRVQVGAGHKRVILTCPTGGGKTVLAAYIILSALSFGQRILFIVHRLELIEQAIAQLAKWGVTDVGVIRSDDKRTNAQAPVQVATIQTLRRRLSDPPFADMIFIDECHLAGADSYKAVLAIYLEAVVIGLTATPCRLDGKPLGVPDGVFDSMVHAATYAELIADGFIVKPVCYGTVHVPQLDKVHTEHGDYKIDELESVMLEADVLGDTVQEYLTRLRDRRTVIFACTVRHSKSIVDRLLAAGVKAAHVDADTPMVDRQDISKRLDWGQLEVVSNVGIYTEGWDQPCVKGLMIARPTKSLVLLRQMAGRVLRPWCDSTPPHRAWRPGDGQPMSPIIIDQGQNLERHGMPHDDIAWALDGIAKNPRKHKPTKCIKCQAYINHYPCEACGYAPPVSPRVVEDRSKKLVEVEFNDPRRSSFNALVEKARLLGYKPGFAGAKYREQWGDWPPWSWGQEAKARFEVDVQWQRRLVDRANARARFQDNEREMGQDVYDSDDDFRGFLQ